jgi:hypothetical protein
MSRRQRYAVGLGAAALIGAAAAVSCRGIPHRHTWAERDYQVVHGSDIENAADTSLA